MLGLYRRKVIPLVGGSQEGMEIFPCDLEPRPPYQMHIIDQDFDVGDGIAAKHRGCSANRPQIDPPRS
jgi:hypothetical protein